MMMRNARVVMLLFVGLCSAFMYGNESNFSLEFSNTQGNLIWSNGIIQYSDDARIQDVRTISTELGFDTEHLFLKSFELWHFALSSSEEYPFMLWFDVSTRANLFNIVHGIYQNTLNTQTRFSPQIELGLFGFDTIQYNILNLYMIPILGYRYELMSNVYLIAKFGLFLNLKSITLRSEINRYLDQQDRNNRGYDFSFTNTIALHFVLSSDSVLNLYARYNLYTNNDTSIYPIKELHTFFVGIGIDFALY
ncbi:hypothetical protein [uncultured Helicobacter sp.]|uniref:hypothetical protein n=1 Tax=uncultured Helicobacter sp. TaxID=175537 RepID=UPI00374EA374